MSDIAILDVSARFAHFEPSHIADRFAGARQRIFNRFLEAIRRRTDYFNFFVNVFTHAPSISRP